MNPQPHPNRWRILLVLCMSLLITVVDGTIVNTALPTLARDLDADSGQLQWIVDAYTLVFAGLLLLAGTLGDRYGRDRALSFGLGVFGVGSLIATVAASPAELIATRALMGAGAAFVMPATLSILSSVFTDAAERAKAISLWAAVSGLGVAIGPSAGGFLLDHFVWGSVFAVNVPFVLGTLIAIRRIVPRSERQTAPLDLIGAGLSVAGLTALTWTLIEAPSYGWTSATTIAAAAGSVALLGSFAAWEMHTTHPMMDLALFRNPRFSAAVGAITVVFFGLFGALFLLTQIQQFVMGYDAFGAGVRALPFAATLGVTSPLAAVIAKRVGTKLPVAAGLVLMAAGFGVMSTTQSDSGYGLLLAATMLMAAGMGLAMAPSTEAIMGSLPLSKAGIGSAMNDATREIGSVLGVAIMGSIAASGYASGLGDATAHLEPGQAAAVKESIGAAAAIAQQTGDSHLLSVAQDAFVAAADHGVIVAAIVALLGAAAAWKFLPAHAEDAAEPRAAAAELAAA
jgi:EmrB/QacA subfamily drug resistance transporter